MINLTPTEAKYIEEVLEDVLDETEIATDKMEDRVRVALEIISSCNKTFERGGG